jgi:dodecin
LRRPLRRATRACCGRDDPDGLTRALLAFGQPEAEREAKMTEHVYKVVELVGTSKTTVSDAIQTAISRAGATVRNLRWFEVVQVRGAVGTDGKVDHYQVTLKAGFTLEGG